jgi:hypothetical protein
LGKAAKARGVRFGRPEALTTFQRAEALHRHDAGEAATEIARSFQLRGRPVLTQSPKADMDRRPLSTSAPAYSEG